MKRPIYQLFLPNFGVKCHLRDLIQVQASVTQYLVKVHSHTKFNIQYSKIAEGYKKGQKVEEKMGAEERRPRQDGGLKAEVCESSQAVYRSSLCKEILASGV